MKVLNSISLEVKPPTYSVSRLKSYSECSQAYNHRYNLKTPYNRFSESTIMGSLVHEALEFLYTTEDESIIYCIDAFLKSSWWALMKGGVLPPSTDPSVVDLVWNELMSSVEIVNQLLEKASAGYVGLDAIRTKDGRVPSNPRMTTQWKNLEESMGLNEIKKSVNNTLHLLNPDLENISVVDAFANAYNLCNTYRTPHDIEEILHLELPLSDWDANTLSFNNPVLMPPEYGGEEGVYLNSYIDMVARVEGGKLAVIDHKTSKELVTPEMVQNNVQLNSYVYGYEELTGETVDFIGINHIRSNTLIMVPVDRDIHEECISSLFSTHKYIKYNLYKKHTPDSNYSPCLSSFGNVCPFLKYCWPKFNAH